MRLRLCGVAAIAVEVEEVAITIVVVLLIEPLRHSEVACVEEKTKQKL